MNYSSYASTPNRDYYYEGDVKYASPSPTPSPRGHFGYETPQRPATRAHFRGMSGSYDYSTPRQPAFSPRYNSDGRYATVNVSQSRSSRKQSFSSPRTKRERRSSYSYYRASDSHGESDEDEYIEINGVTYVLPARSRSKRYNKGFQYSHDNAAGYGTNYYCYTQSGYPTYDREASYASPRHEPETRRPTTRRASTSAPQRPSTARPATARPSSSHKKQGPPVARKATDADAKKHRIPAGYSLKNWDPDEEPITLLGSVFDANSLGKWIYDWTVYHHGPNTPISEMAGELWLLLIQVAGKVKRSEECIPRIRTKDNRDMIEEFIESGERLTEKLRKLLKACEAPMLKAEKSKKAQLGNNAGVQFVRTMFGRERELERTEKFMQSVRLWNLRFDANCEEVLKKPSM